MCPNGQLPEPLLMLLGGDGGKKLEEHMKDVLRMVSQAVGLAGLEVSLQYGLQKNGVARTKAENGFIQGHATLAKVIH